MSGVRALVVTLYALAAGCVALGSLVLAQAATGSVLVGGVVFVAVTVAAAAGRDRVYQLHRDAYAQLQANARR